MWQITGLAMEGLPAAFASTARPAIITLSWNRSSFWHSSTFFQLSIPRFILCGNYSAWQALREVFYAFSRQRQALSLPSAGL